MSTINTLQFSDLTELSQLGTGNEYDNSKNTDTDAAKAPLQKICEAKKIHLSLVLPCITRWSSNYRSMKNMLTLQLCLQLPAVDCEELKALNQKCAKKNQKKVASIILDEQFWQKLQEALDLIGPLLTS